MKISDKSKKRLKQIGLATALLSIGTTTILLNDIGTITINNKNYGIEQTKDHNDKKTIYLKKFKDIYSTCEYYDEHGNEKGQLEKIKYAIILNENIISNGEKILKCIVILEDGNKKSII